MALPEQSAMPQNPGDLIVKSGLPAGTNAIGKTGHDVTGIGDGRQTVTTHGTAVALAASTTCKYVIITALSSNTNRVMIGGSTVVAAVGATSRGTPLSANEKIAFPCDNLADIYVDSITDGEGVQFTYLT